MTTCPYCGQALRMRDPGRARSGANEEGAPPAVGHSISVRFVGHCDGYDGRSHPPLDFSWTLWAEVFVGLPIIAGEPMQAPR